MHGHIFLVGWIPLAPPPLRRVYFGQLVAVFGRFARTASDRGQAVVGVLWKFLLLRDLFQFSSRVVVAWNCHAGLTRRV